MNIYIACSLTNVPIEHFDNYSKSVESLRSQLQNHGYIVENALSNGSKKDSTKDALTNAKNCYDWHQQLINNSDVMIAEVSFPSLGVGIELQLANQRNMPIYLIFNSNMASKASSKPYKISANSVSTINVTHASISSMALGLNCVEHVLEYTEHQQLATEIKYLLDLKAKTISHKS